MGKKTFPKWLEIQKNGNLSVAWKGFTKFDPFDDVEKALRQIIHILEQYGDQRIYFGKERRTIIFLGKISELKQFKEIAQRTLGFLKSSSLDSDTGMIIRKQIELSQKEILTSISEELEKNLKIFFAVMKRGLVIKNEIIREKRILMNVYLGLVNSYDSLSKSPTESNLTRIKNRIAGKGANLINGFEKIIANPYKAKTMLPQIKRLNTIFNISSVAQMQRIIKNAANRLKPVIERELKIQKIKSEIFIKGRG